jgi:hypothetical protein
MLLQYRNVADVQTGFAFRSVLKEYEQKFSVNTSSLRHRLELSWGRDDRSNCCVPGVSGQHECRFMGWTTGIRF